VSHVTFEIYRGSLPPIVPLTCDQKPLFCFLVKTQAPPYALLRVNTEDGVVAGAASPLPKGGFWGVFPLPGECGGSAARLVLCVAFAGLEASTRCLWGMCAFRIQLPCKAVKLGTQKFQLSSHPHQNARLME